MIRVEDYAKPLIAIYTDEVEGYGAADVFAAVSRDDGHTWKRKNISRMADRSSFQLANGEEYYGHCKKPVFQVKGNKILIAWTSKFARGGKPCYAIQKCPDVDGDGSPDACETCTGSDDNEKCGPDYTYDDPYYVNDIWGVSGSQRSVDYTDQGYPEVGEVPYSSVWVARGIIATTSDVSKGIGQFEGDIVWFKPERLTSARRDANQVFMGGADGAGFAIAWQEDPKGLRPGEAKGPGPGWGGATTNHKTDIWYSHVTWDDFAKVDGNFVSGGDPEHDNEDFVERPKALVPMALPVRISDNDAVNTKNANLVDADGNVITPSSGSVEDIAYEDVNLTRCVKFEEGTAIFPDNLPSNHQSSMNCTSCHVPFDMEPNNNAPTQGSPIPLVVVDAANDDYLGGFTNADCVSCHYGNVVPRDRVIAVEAGFDEDGGETAKCTECKAKGGIWKADMEAYYPYDPYPYIVSDPDDVKDGSHGYITAVPGLWSYDNYLGDGGGLHTKINQQGVEMDVAVTTDGRLLDGNTGAARPNLFLQTYTKTIQGDNPSTPDTIETSYTIKSAWAIMAYEESKGLGAGPPETTGEGSGSQDGSGYNPFESIPDAGKNAIYHSFDFQNPELVSGGTILNLPVPGEDGDPYVKVPQYSGSVVTNCDPANENCICVGDTCYEGSYNDDYTDGDPYVQDFTGEQILNRGNARRPRFILQSKASAFGGIKSYDTNGKPIFKHPEYSGTVLIVLYKEGEEGAGRPSDIMARRCVASASGNPYHINNFVQGAQNVSTVMYDEADTWVNPDRDENAKGDGVKICRWTQPEECLGWGSEENPYEDARAHRGGIRGDFVVMGYSYCPNWAASRKAHDKYDFYIRRSFDGGATWTTDPSNTTPVLHTDCFIDPEGMSGSELDEEGNDATGGTKHYMEYTPYQSSPGVGVYEPARNVSLIKNNKISVIEPRIVAVPGTIKVNGVWTDEPEDKQNPNCFYIAYGTSTNLPDVEKAPEDLFLSFSQDKGTTFFEDSWVVNPDSSGQNAGEEVTGWIRLAKGDPEQGEVQIRMTPNAERFYACWLEEGEEGSDIFFRRLTPSAFAGNIIPEKAIDDDGDGYSEYEGDTDDTDACINPGEICGDGTDNDGDGFLDCDDSDCIYCDTCLLSATP